MKEELELQLVAKYPKIFRDYGGDMQKTCMHWGMSCGNGWYDLIDRICARITELDPEGNCYAAQVKEKFGELRFYVDGATEEIYKVLWDMEAESGEICEDCGKPGKTKSVNFWISTLCDECREAIKKRV